MHLCNDWTAWTAQTRGKKDLWVVVEWGGDGGGRGRGGWRGHRLIPVQLKMTLWAGEVYMTLKAHTTLSVNFAQEGSLWKSEGAEKKRQWMREWMNVCLSEKERNVKNSIIVACESIVWTMLIFKGEATGLGGHMNLCWVCSSLVMFALKAVQ